MSDFRSNSLLRPFNLAASTAALWLLLFSTGPVASAQDNTLHEFSRQQLTSTYYSEGTAVGDLNNDGIKDIVYGPFWFAGPEFAEKHEIYAPVAQPMEKYADHFFAWIYDFDKDGNSDVFTVGFPGTPAFVYKNPGLKGAASDQPAKHWEKIQVFDWVSNESP